MQAQQTKPETYTSLQDFITKTRKLLTKQQESQKQHFQKLTSQKSASQIQDEGAGLANMTIINSKQGFYDRIIITAAKAYYSQKNRLQIPEHCKLQVGDDVAIYSGDTMIASGVIYRRTPEKIKISVGLDPEEDNIDFQDMKVNIILKWNQVTYRRYFQILDLLQNPYENTNISLKQLFFKQQCPQYHQKQPQKYQNQKMNNQQNLAIANGLVQQCHLIHGPPGTGKTTTVCQLIVEAVKKGEKVLACAPSNIAVDNIVQGISRRVNCIRVGNPARIINQVIQRCLDFVVGKSQGQWKNQQKRLNAAQKKLKRTKVKSQRKQIYGQIKQIRTQIKNMQQQVITEILQDAQVICCTNVGAADKVFKRYLSKRKFDLVIIDQCGQGLQVSCWIPISKAKRVVLAGDHKQLPPTVKFQTDSLLSYTLFSRCMQQLTYLPSTMLQVQYRMNSSIMGWSNKQFYQNKLIADKSVQKHTLKQIYNNVDEQQAVLMFVDTAGCQVGEEGGSMESKMNVGQADIVCHIYKKLNKYGVKGKDIAILTPYSKQVTLIKNTLLQQQCEQTQVSTVDGIQGRQKQCIIISMVRSNPQKQIGFLKDWRRMNVAVTRARRMLIIVGDSDCITVDEKIKKLVQWVTEHGTVQSAQQLKYDPTIRFGMGKISMPGDQHKKQPNLQNKQKQQKQKKKDKKQKKQQKTIKNSQKTEQVNKKQHTIEQNENMKQTFRALIKQLKQPMIVEDLSAYQRKMMHEVAEQFGYDHITSEDKSKITIKPDMQKIRQEQKKQAMRKKRDKKLLNRNKKVSGPQNIKQLIGDQTSSEDQNQQNNIQANSSDDEVTVKQVKKQQKITNNKNQLNMQKVQKIQQKIQQAKQIEPKKKKNKKNKGKQAQNQGQEDWQKLLDQFTSDITKNDQCFKCKKKITSVTSIQCRFCKLNFCRHDVLAQQHGCQDAARQDARKDNLDKYLQQGARKIKQKLKEQEQQRRKKPKESEKQKQKDKKK